MSRCILILLHQLMPCIKLQLLFWQIDNNQQSLLRALIKNLELEMFEVVFSFCRGHRCVCSEKCTVSTLRRNTNQHLCILNQEIFHYAYHRGLPIFPLTFFLNRILLPMTQRHRWATLAPIPPSRLPNSMNHLTADAWMSVHYYCVLSLKFFNTS